MTTTITLEDKVGQIAAEHPVATRVFARHKIDFCCGGGQPLKDICAKQGLDAQQVLGEIQQELVQGEAFNEQRWVDAPLADLIDHILHVYHKPLVEELPRLEAMAAKVTRVHGDKDPQRLPQLLQVFLELKDELEQHMAKEEQVLFPMIKAGNGAMAEGPVSVMEHEHEVAGLCLRKLRELTDDYTVPEHACNTWRALWHGLEALEQEMHEHIHLENNILFPRALAS